MRIIRYPHHRSLRQAACVTIGNFDGIHLGHQALISDVVSKAKKQGCLSVVVTMMPLPMQYFNGKSSVDVLTQFKHKANILDSMGVDVMCVLNFNELLADMSAREFFLRVLVKGLCAQYILVGDDFRFGSNRTGGYEQLRTWSQAENIVAKQLHSVTVSGERVSSSDIRSQLRHGEFASAKKMLGRHFNLLGRVGHGRKLGRTLGYPTINISLRAGGFPLHGVYATEIIIHGQCHQSVTSVGINPTVGGNAKRVEVYVFDFNANVYGQSVEVLFYKKLRNEVEFDNINDLTSAISQDVKRSREFFASYKGELV